MIQNEEFTGEKVKLYRAAQSGLLSAAVAPTIADFTDRLPIRLVAVVLGGLLVVALGATSLDHSLRADIQQTHRFSQGYTPAFPALLDAPKRKHRIWSYDPNAMHVTRRDAALHRLYGNTRYLGWWAFLLAVIATGVSIWRRSYREEAEALFGKDTTGYRDFMASLSPDPDTVARRELQNDWLLSGVPSEPQPDPASRPVFGRKQA